MHIIFLYNLLISKHIFFTNSSTAFSCRHHKKDERISRLQQQCHCRIAHLLMLLWKIQTWDNHWRISQDYTEERNNACCTIIVFRFSRVRLDVWREALSWNKTIHISDREFTSIPLTCTFCFVQLLVVGSTLQNIPNRANVFLRQIYSSGAGVECVFHFCSFFQKFSMPVTFLEFLQTCFSKLRLKSS